MDKVIGYCGYVCNNCPVFIATKEKDMDKKQYLIEQIANKHSLTPEDINCYGCTATDESKRFKHCKVCEKRAKGLGNLNSK